MPPNANGDPVRRHARIAGALLWASAVAFAVSLCAAFALPLWQRSQRVARARTTITHLRLFETAFRAYAHQHGDWPPSAAPGTFPAGVESLLKTTPWDRPSPIGGQYVWLVDTLQNGQRLHAVVGIVGLHGTPVSLDSLQMVELLEQAKHQKLPPNRLRLGFRNEPIYVLEN